MNKIWYCLLTLLFISAGNTAAQVYNRDVTFTSQAQIDAFYGNIITGTLVIRESVPGNITNIDSLHRLEQAASIIIENNQALKSIAPLANLRGIGKTDANNKDSLIIRNNPSLAAFCGLYQLFTTGSFANRDPVIIISGNKNNPTRSEIELTGPCSDFIEPVYWGDLLIDSQADADTFNYASVAGELRIDEAAPGSIINLNGLSELKIIGKGLVINSNTMLQNVDSLTNLSALKYLNVINNDALLNLDGLTGLTQIVYYFSPLFVLRISNNNSLTNLDGLSGLTYVDGPVRIDSNQVLNNINGLSNLISYRTLEIIGNPSLVNIDALSKVYSISGGWQSYERGLVISNNDALPDLKGLKNLHVINQFLLEGNDGLKNLSGLDSLESAGSISIVDNDSLQNLNGLYRLKYLDYSIALRNLPSLTNINALSSLIIANGLYIEGTSITNVDSLISLQALNLLSLKNNTHLENLDGLKNLSRLGPYPMEMMDDPYLVLEIENNPVLKNLNGLWLANSPYYYNIIDIKNNAMLTEFCGIYQLVSDSIDRYYETNIENNGANPTLQEIRANGPCQKSERSFIAVLLGKNVYEPVITEGSGGAIFKVNAAQDTLEYWIRLCELKCPLTKLELRYGVHGGYGYTIMDLTPNVVVLPGSLDAWAHGIWTVNDSLPLSLTYLSQLDRGYLHLQAYTTGYPSGEIRGQLTNNIPVNLYANLNGTQEVPPVSTMGSGEGWFTLSGDGDSLYYNVRAFNLSAPVTAAHFHKADIDSAGPPVKPISFAGDSLSEGWWTNMDAAPLTPELVADLLGCYIYVNVHTSNHPAGEIRGQLNKTVEMPMDYMTIWAARNNEDVNKNAMLSFYSLTEGKTFMNNEGEITGYDGQKNIVDMAIDIGGNIYLLNNSYTSMLYRIRPEQFDFNGSTSLRAYQMGRLRTSPDDKYVWMTSIQFIKGKLYGFDNKTNKLYEINPGNAHVTEITQLSLEEGTNAGFALAADGFVYLLKKTGDLKSELWRFNNFPDADLTLVTEISAGLSLLTAHPNGNLYTSSNEKLYEINPNIKTVAVLNGHKMDAAAMDFDMFTETHTTASAIEGFTPVDGITSVGQFTGLPAEYKLEQNYPNPFNPGTLIKFALPEAGHVKLVVYNALGEIVKTLVNDNREAGYYETWFNASALASGMYIYRIEAGSYVKSVKMMLLK